MKPYTDWGSTLPALLFHPPAAGRHVREPVATMGTPEEKGSAGIEINPTKCHGFYP